jgi:hypothetical protein
MNTIHNENYELQANRNRSSGLETKWTVQLEGPAKSFIYVIAHDHWDVGNFCWNSWLTFVSNW